VLASTIRGRGMTNFELELQTKENGTRHLLVTATPRKDTDNNVCGVFCLTHDVTESTRYNRAVAGMASELRQLIDTANAPIFGIDCVGYVGRQQVARR
jgi:PAS domain-containing protein